jgi:hypothetical protein
MSHKTIALIDPVWGGHSPSYFVQYWAALVCQQNESELDFTLIGFSPQPEQTRKLLASRGVKDARIFPLETPLRSHYPHSRRGNVGFALAHWKSLRKVVQQAEDEDRKPVSLALIIWLEPFLAQFLTGTLVERHFRRPWAGLYLHPFTFRIKQSRRLRLLEKIFPQYGAVQARNCRAVLTLDEGIAAAMSRRIGKPVLAMPDVADASTPDPNFQLPHEVKKRAGGRLVCGLIGVLQKRKGILSFIEAAKAKPPDWFFVIAGALIKNDFTAEELCLVKEFFDSQPQNCAAWLTHLDEASLNATVCACDVLFAAYETFPHSSTILAKAALYDKLAIVSQGFLMSERVARHNLGWILPESTPAALLDLLTHTDRQVVQEKKIHARFADYTREHSEAKLRSVMGQLISKNGATGDSLKHFPP